MHRQITRIFRHHVKSVAFDANLRNCQPQRFLEERGSTRPCTEHQFVIVDDLRLTVLLDLNLVFSDNSNHFRVVEGFVVIRFVLFEISVQFTAVFVPVE